MNPTEVKIEKKRRHLKMCVGKHSRLLASINKSERLLNHLGRKIYNLQIQISLLENMNPRATPAQAQEGFRKMREAAK